MCRVLSLRDIPIPVVSIIHNKYHNSQQLPKTKMTTEEPTTLADNKRERDSTSNDEATMQAKKAKLALDTEGTAASDEPAPVTAESNEIDADDADAPTSLKLKLSNVPKFSTKKELEKFIKSLDLPVPKVKKPPKVTFAYLSYENKQDYDTALEKLNNIEFRKNTIQCEPATNSMRSRDNNRNNDRNDRKPREQTQQEDTRTPAERINDQVTPLWRVPYEEQLVVKQKEVQKLVNRFVRELRTTISKTEKMQAFNKKMVEQEKKDLVADVEEKKADGTESKGTSGENKEASVEESPAKEVTRKQTIQVEFPEVLPIIPSPQQTHYRNKVEFTFGVSPDGAKTLGFLLGAFKDGELNVCSPYECLHTSQESLRIAKVLEEYINSVGEQWDVYDRKTNRGVWRLALVRNNERGETIVVVQINDEGLSVQDVDTIKTSLKEFVEAKCQSGECRVDGLMIQTYNSTHNTFSTTDPCVPLFGVTTISSQLCNLDFQISPTSFFQVNHDAAEKLYEGVRGWVGLGANNETLESVETNDADKTSKTNDKIVLDLCCGTGTIGQILASAPNPPTLVIGVEMVESAIVDAKANAERNNIQNVKYICSKVENGMKEVLEIAGDKELVAVLDPPRSGVHPSVVRALRDTQHVKRIIYVCCDFGNNNTMGNFVDFCRPPSNKFRGQPFRVTRVQAYDLFPGTKHCEICIELVRD